MSRIWTRDNAHLVVQLLAAHPELRTGPIASAIESAFPELDDGECARFKRIPDAWAIRNHEREVDILEVECTHPLPRSVFWDICLLWNALDAIGVTLRLYVVGRYGHINEVDIGVEYLRLVKEDAGTQQTSVSVAFAKRARGLNPPPPTESAGTYAAPDGSAVRGSSGRRNRQRIARLGDGMVRRDRRRDE